MPATVNGIRRYLASGQIKGVGEVLAGRMVETYGEKVLEILDTEPEKLLKVEGVGKKKLQEIKASWDAQHEVRSLLLFCRPTRFRPPLPARFTSSTAPRPNPASGPIPTSWPTRSGYWLQDRRQHALRLGFAKDSPERVQAALVYVLFSLS
jgi:exodeoxyribonuclease V alpha subunit